MRFFFQNKVLQTIALSVFFAGFANPFLLSKGLRLFKIDHENYTIKQSPFIDAKHSTSTVLALRHLSIHAIVKKTNSQKIEKLFLHKTFYYFESILLLKEHKHYLCSQILLILCKLQI